MNSDDSSDSGVCTLVQGSSQEKCVRYGEVMAQNFSIFCQFKSKLAFTHTIAFKWKEK